MGHATLISLSAVAIVIGSHVIAKRLGFEQEYKDLLLPVILVTVPVLVTGLYTKANTTLRLGSNTYRLQLIS